MKSKQKMLMCQSTGKKQLAIAGSCKNVYMICEECQSSLLFNIEDDGCMKISLRPADYNSSAKDIAGSASVNQAGTKFNYHKQGKT